MREIGAFEAKNTFGHLLDQVEHGAEIVITRRGKAVAKLVPAESGFDRVKAKRAVAGILEAYRQALQGESNAGSLASVWGQLEYLSGMLQKEKPDIAAKLQEVLKKARRI